MSLKSLIIIAGVSGVGKSTLMRRMNQEGLRFYITGMQVIYIDSDILRILRFANIHKAQSIAIIGRRFFMPPS